MILLFIVNVIVVTLVTREFCQKTTEENPSEKTEEEEKNAIDLPAVELTTEEELVNKKSGQEVTKENPSLTEAEEKKRVQTEEEDNARSPVSTTIDQEDSGETTDEPSKAEKRKDSTASETGEEGNEDDSAKLPKEQESGKQTEEADVEMISVEASSPEEDKAEAEDQGEKPEMESVQQSKPFYELKAALTAMWLPAVVGDKKKMFIAASLSTLFTKIVMLLVSVILAFFFQEKMHPHPFILWSRVGKSPDTCTS